MCLSRIGPTCCFAPGFYSVSPRFISCVFPGINIGRGDQTSYFNRSLSFFLFLCVFISLIVTDRVLLTSILSVLSFSYEYI